MSKETADEASSDKTRKLVFEDEKFGVRFFLVKPSDVPIYVEYGTADIGVVGKDILVEDKPDVYELLDTNLGECRLNVASKAGFIDDNSKLLRVATKFVNTAKAYYDMKNREIEIIKLNGSVELAPILGMSDVILDLVETGATLKENNLVENDPAIMYVSARLIANKSSYKFKRKKIVELVADMKKVIPPKKNPDAVFEVPYDKNL